MLNNIAYHTGEALSPIILFVLVAACSVVAAINLVQYYRSRKSEGDFFQILKNTWKRANDLEKICFWAIAASLMLVAAMYLWYKF